MGVFTTGTLQLPNQLAGTFVDKVRETSTVARLAPATAGSSILNDQYTLITAEPEASFVAESGKKPEHEMTTAPIITGNYKAVVTLRYTREVLWADEDTQLGIISESFDSLAAAGARALDYGIYHAVSPLEGTAITGATALTSVANQATATADAVADMDALPDAVINGGFDFNGVALAVTYANTLRKVRIGADQVKAFPEISLNPRQTTDVSGIPAAVSNTVNGARITPATGIQAIGGDFSKIKWGVVREIPTRLIEYGDPDNTGRDLQGYNEVALRYEILYKWAVLDPKAFTVLKVAEG